MKALWSGLLLLVVAGILYTVSTALGQITLVLTNAITLGR